MKYVKTPLTIQEIEVLKINFGSHTKITVDIEKEELVIGCPLHADGEAILLQNGSKPEMIWGGWIHFDLKQITTTAVLNIRPRLNNLSMEILDNNRRESFFKAVKKIFSVLWTP